MAACVLKDTKGVISRRLLVSCEYGIKRLQM